MPAKSFTLLQASVRPSASLALGLRGSVYWVLKTPLWTGPKRSVGKGWETEQVRKPMSTSYRSWGVVYRDSQVRGVQWAWTISLQGTLCELVGMRPASILLSRRWKLQRRMNPQDRCIGGFRAWGETTRGWRIVNLGRAGGLGSRLTNQRPGQWALHTLEKAWILFTV